MQRAYILLLCGMKIVFNPKSGYTFKPHLNDLLVNASNNQIFNQDGKKSAIKKNKVIIPPSSVFQPLPLKEKVGKIQFNRMGNGYIVDTFI